ncbi:MAG: LysE family translocator [Pseudomonadota bacterium]
MTWELLIGLTAFAFASSITPGPNNMMLMASGANYGFARTVPHMLGVGIGFTAMIVLVGAGVIGLFEALPVTRTILTVLSLAYLLWLAWKVATAVAPEAKGAAGRPLNFWQAAAFQWVNVKAWSMALYAITAFAPDRTGLAILIVAAVFGAINLPCVSIWTLIGREISRFLGTPGRLRAFNWSMAALLLGSTLPFLAS